jgi:hypothetical protein
MRNHSELMTSVLETADVQSVVEVGAFAGDLTRLLAAWAQPRGAVISAVDPAPQPALAELGEEDNGVELVRETSLEALAHIDLPDAIILDGDHNYYTVSEELRLIGERSDTFPLVILHDVCWPHARRDDYFDPEQIPADYRQPLMPEGEGIMPGDEGSSVGGLPYPKSAAREGGSRNGVRTAVEEYVDAHPGLTFAVVPVFFGFGVVWSDDAPYAGNLATLLEFWDRNPVLERLEANRVFQIAQAWQLKELQARQVPVLERLLQSSAFALAEKLSRVRERAGVGKGATVVSKDEIRRALGR